MPSAPEESAVFLPEAITAFIKLVNSALKLLSQLITPSPLRWAKLEMLRVSRISCAVIPESSGRLRFFRINLAHSIASTPPGASGLIASGNNSALPSTTAERSRKQFKVNCTAFFTSSERILLSRSQSMNSRNFRSKRSASISIEVTAHNASSSLRILAISPAELTRNCKPPPIMRNRKSPFGA